jgi:DNA polymerase III alpha subunit (gram-positive type)
VAKGGKNFRNTEFFGFEGDKIKRIDVYFGATYQNGVFVRQTES